MVLLLFAEILATAKVLEQKPETETTEDNSILKPETEDAQVETPISSNAEDMADQTKMT
jgi:hypothetical protein